MVSSITDMLDDLLSGEFAWDIDEEQGHVTVYLPGHPSRARIHVSPGVSFDELRELVHEPVLELLADIYLVNRKGE